MNCYKGNSVTTNLLHNSLGMWDWFRHQLCSNIMFMRIRCINLLKGEPNHITIKMTIHSAIVTRHKMLPSTLKGD